MTEEDYQVLCKLDLRALHTGYIHDFPEIIYDYISKEEDDEFYEKIRKILKEEFGI